MVVIFHQSKTLKIENLEDYFMTKACALYSRRGIPPEVNMFKSFEVVTLEFLKHVTEEEAAYLVTYACFCLKRLQCY